MSDEVKRIQANLTVYANDPANAVRAIEALNRVMLGLVLDGYDCELCAGPEPAFDYADSDDEDSTTD